MVSVGMEIQQTMYTTAYLTRGFVTKQNMQNKEMKRTMMERNVFGLPVYSSVVLLLFSSDEGRITVCWFCTRSTRYFVAARIISACEPHKILRLPQHLMGGQNRTPNRSFPTIPKHKN